MAVAKAYGARKIIAFDIEQSRVDFAVKNYANIGVLCPTDKVDDPVSFGRDFILEKLRENGLEFGVDVAIEVTGAESAVSMAIYALRAQGTCKSKHEEQRTCRVQVTKLHLQYRCPGWTTLEASKSSNAPSYGQRAYYSGQVLLFQRIFSLANHYDHVGTVSYGWGCFEEAIDLIDRKLVDLSPMITATYPLTKSQEAFEAQLRRSDIKIIIMNQE
jgi:D-xylulose reductase